MFYILQILRFYLVGGNYKKLFLAVGFFTYHLTIGDIVWCREWQLEEESRTLQNIHVRDINTLFRGHVNSQT